MLLGLSKMVAFEGSNTHPIVVLKRLSNVGLNPTENFKGRVKYARKVNIVLTVLLSL